MHKLIQKSFISITLGIFAIALLSSCITYKKQPVVNGSISGEIDQPISQTKIYLFKGDSLESLLDSIITSDPSFKFEDLLPGSYSLYAINIGVKTGSKIVTHIRVKPDKDTLVHVELNPILSVQIMPTPFLFVDSVFFFSIPIALGPGGSYTLNYRENETGKLTIKFPGNPNFYEYEFIIAGQSFITKKITPSSPSYSPIGLVYNSKYKDKSMKIYLGKIGTDTTKTFGSKYVGLEGHVNIFGTLNKLEISVDTQKTFTPLPRTGTGWFKNIFLNPGKNLITVKGYAVVNNAGVDSTVITSRTFPIYYNPELEDLEGPIIQGVNLKGPDPLGLYPNFDTLSTNPYEISGHVFDESGVHVYIGGELVRTRSESHFRKTLTLREGKNIFSVRLVDNSKIRNETRISYGIFYKP